MVNMYKRVLFLFFETLTAFSKGRSLLTKLQIFKPLLCFLEKLDCTSGTRVKYSRKLPRFM